MSAAERAAAYAKVLPNPTEEAALRFVAGRDLEPERIIAWLDQTDLNDANDGLMRLLPTLYPMIEPLGLNHPEIDRIRGIYRHTLYRNRLIMHRGTLIVKALEDGGIPSILLKGAALLCTEGVDPGTRPMSDFDLLVPHDTDLDRVDRLIRASDFPEPRLRMRFSHFLSLYDRNGLEYDVQSALSYTNAFPPTNRIFWEHRQQASYQGDRFHVLCPAHFVFHTVTHGMWRNIVSPVRWIADVLQITQAHPHLDWALVGEAAALFRFQDPALAGLEYLLRAGFVGPEVLPAIAVMQDSVDYAFDRRLFRNAKLYSETETRAQRFRRLFDEYSRKSAFEQRRRTPLGMMRFLNDRIGERTLLQGVKRIVLNERT